MSKCRPHDWQQTEVRRPPARADLSEQALWQCQKCLRIDWWAHLESHPSVPYQNHGEADTAAVSGPGTTPIRDRGPGASYGVRR